MAYIEDAHCDIGRQVKANCAVIAEGKRSDWSKDECKETRREWKEK